MMRSHQRRSLAGRDVPAIGLGCMNLSHAYGGAPDEAGGVRLLERAYELGYRHFDTATLYGFGRNESLVGKALAPVRDRVFIASKGGMAGVDGRREIDGRPDTLRRHVDASLARLQVDHIDLYYLHRWDQRVPIEESLAALVEAQEDGKIGAIGLSEVSAPTLERAQGSAPIAAVQNEYSPWTRNCELGVSEACRRSGVALVAFSPVCRGFLGIDWRRFDGFEPGDIRAGMPRFQAASLDANRPWLEEFRALAAEWAVSPSQLALAWLLARGEHVVPIPGTTSEAHLEENFLAGSVALGEEVLRRVSEVLAPERISGNRYPPSTQAEIDTEQFPWELAGAARP
jgi:aryl-alcohol dehydrogenase-like predicted oxidoreductase